MGVQPKSPITDPERTTKIRALLAPEIKAALEEFLKKNAYLKKFGFITDSDAHFVSNIGDVYNVIYMEHRSFTEFHKALKGQDDRWIDTMAFRTATASADTNVRT